MNRWPPKTEKLLSKSAFRERPRVGAQKGGSENPLKTLRFLYQGFFFSQAFFRYFSCTSHGSCAMIKNAGKTFTSKISYVQGVFRGFEKVEKGAFSNPPFCSPTLCHPNALPLFWRQSGMRHFSRWSQIAIQVPTAFHALLT